MKVSKNFGVMRNKRGGEAGKLKREVNEDEDAM